MSHLYPVFARGNFWNIESTVGGSKNTPTCSSCSPFEDCIHTSFGKGLTFRVDNDTLNCRLAFKDQIDFIFLA